tara:strand:+ start:323 stop:850 length:528 start_codon:yes stop_codon:yes gene_type:complete
MVMELPAVINCRKIPENGLHVEGTISPERISRLGPEFNISAPVLARINVKIGTLKKIRVVGVLFTELNARCQRCLEWMPIPIETEFDLALKENGSVDDKFSERHEEDNITLTDGLLNLTEMLEDEILLSCPMIPSHKATESCDRNFTKARSLRDSDSQRPFANLDKLFKRDGQNK